MKESKGEIYSYIYSWLAQLCRISRHWSSLSGFAVSVRSLVGHTYAQAATGCRSMVLPGVLNYAAHTIHSCHMPFLLVIFSSMATGCRSMVLPGVLNHAMRSSMLKSRRRHWSALFGNQAHKLHVLAHCLPRDMFGQQVRWIF